MVVNEACEVRRERENENYLSRERDLQFNDTAPKTLVPGSNGSHLGFHARIFVPSSSPFLPFRFLNFHFITMANR